MPRKKADQPDLELESTLEDSTDESPIEVSADEEIADMPEAPETVPADTEADESPEESQPSGTENPEGAEPVPPEAEKDTDPPGIDTVGTEPENSGATLVAAARRAARENILGFDEQRSVETQADKRASDILDLYESLKSKRILTDFIKGVERSQSNPMLSYAVLYHGDIKVIIPASEAVTLPDDLRGRRPEDILHYLITKRLGAEIDYIVQHIDQETGIAAASRLEAMAKRRREMYYGADRDGNNLVYEGVCAEARVISVIRAGIFADVLGVETYIPMRELSYQRWMDAAQHFLPGQRILVRILDIDREDRDNIRVTASVKQAGENPIKNALKKFSIGNRYIGTVSMVDEHGVFVAMDGGIDCLCQYPSRGRPPRGSRVTVRILGINEDAGRIWGVITHMTTRT